MRVLFAPLRALLFCLDFFFGKAARRKSNFSALWKYKIQDVPPSTRAVMLVWLCPEISRSLVTVILCQSNNRSPNENYYVCWHITWRILGLHIACIWHLSPYV